jgi:hypothetical protein
MKFMAKQMTNMVSTIRLSDDQYTQTGRETLKELLRIHFPDSMLTDDSNIGQGQQNVDICRCTKYRGNWNLARNVLNQSISQN